MVACSTDPLAGKDAGVVEEEPPEIQITNVRYRYYEGNELAISGVASDIGYSTSSGAVFSKDLKAIFHGRAPREDEQMAQLEDGGSPEALQTGDESVHQTTGDEGDAGAEVVEIAEEKLAILTRGEVEVVNAADLKGIDSEEPTQTGDASKITAGENNEAASHAQDKGDKSEDFGDIVAEATAIQGNVALRWVDALNGVRLRDINGTEAVTERASIDAKGHRIFSETPVIVNGRGVVATAQSGFLLHFRGDRVLHFQGPIQSRIFAVDPSEDTPKHLRPMPPVIRPKKAKIPESASSKSQKITSENEKSGNKNQGKNSREKNNGKQRRKHSSAKEVKSKKNLPNGG